MIFRDESEVAWSSIVSHPMKHLFSKLPLLQTCCIDECPGTCGAYHVQPDSTINEPILEVWGKQWITHSFVSAAPDKADTFTVHVRIPCDLQMALQGCSGVGGVYAEPKEVDGRTPAKEYQVFWVARACHRDLVHLKQTTEGIIGLARMGTRMGIRCHISKAEEVHAAIRPSGSYLPQGRKLTFLLGPLPFGTLKSSVSKIVETIGWSARPLHPIAAASHVAGVMWRVQAIESPSQSIVSTDHGDILITRVDTPSREVKVQPSVVAGGPTFSLVTSGSASSSGVDPLQLNDPWEIYSSKGVSTKPAVSVQATDPTEYLEKKVMEAVLAKLPKPNMEVDDEGGHVQFQQRVEDLESKVNQLHEQQVKLHSQVCEQGQSQHAQIVSLQSQGMRLEQAVSDQATNLGNFQTQFKQQLESQQGQLDSLFKQQMDRIEDLFQKKARTS